MSTILNPSHSPKQGPSSNQDTGRLGSRYEIINLDRTLASTVETGGCV